jgi:hypothetical protein
VHIVVDTNLLLIATTAQMIFQMLGVDHCVIFIITNLDQSVLYVTAEITELEIPLHVKSIKQSGENSPSFTYEECYKGKKLNPGTHKEEDQTHSVMMMIMKTLHQLQIILALPDITVWKLFALHVEW